MRGIVTVALALWAAPAVVGVGADVARAQSGDAASLPVPGVEASTMPGFDPVSRTDYLRRHAFSLDHFLEYAPGGLVVRLGPIGNPAAYSRWGIGRGRATLMLDGIELNDPQNGVAPWVHAPTSGIGNLRADRSRTWIDGVVDIETAPPPRGRPSTFIELSKGSNDMRQRRVRFASEEGRIGIDLSYDEVLDDGYPYDATGVIGDEPNFGKSRSRNSGIVLRGAPDEYTRFNVGLRRFTSSTTGLLDDPAAEGFRSGHVAWLEAGVGPASMTMFGRGYSSDLPDSSAASETAGLILRGGVTRERWSWTGSATAERIEADQTVGVRAASELTRGQADMRASRRVGGTGQLELGAAVASDDETPLAWSASARVARESAGSTLSASLARVFRIPSLGERYLPAHVTDGNTLSGAADLDPESALEVRGDWELRGEGFANRVRASWIDARGTIAFRPRVVGSETWRVAANAPTAASMMFLEERIRIEAPLGPLQFYADGSFMLSSGDRVEAFVSVPETMASASARIGGEMFEQTSALYVAAEFLSVDARMDYNGVPLPAFDVVNLSLEGRLLDARLYLRYLNVLDEAYATQDGYLMTPRTFAYGIEWTLFD